MFDITMKFDNYRFKVVLISTKSLKMSIDEKIVNISKEDLDSLNRILRYIDEKTNSNTLDPIRFNIVINDDITFEGDSSSNKNFYMLNDWLGDIYDR